MAVGRGRGSAGGQNGLLGLAAAYSQGTRAAFMERYMADLKRLADRNDLPEGARWFDSHCHLEPWRDFVVA